MKLVTDTGEEYRIERVASVDVTEDTDLVVEVKEDISASAILSIVGYVKNALGVKNVLVLPGGMELSVLRNRNKLVELLSETREVANAALEYIDAIPGDVQFTEAMPGFDRDWANGVLGEELV